MSARQLSASRINCVTWGGLRDLRASSATLQSRVSIPGADGAIPGIVVHPHLGTVQVAEGERSANPFGGELRDDAVRGRGAIDMKNVGAIQQTISRSIVRRGRPPRCEEVFLWLADKKEGGKPMAQALLCDRFDLVARRDTAFVSLRSKPLRY